VYDITDCQTYGHVEMWLTVARKIDDFDVVIMLVGNKSDLQHLRCVSFEEAQEFANEKGLFFIETSALESTNVAEAFHRLVREIIPILERKRIKASHESDTDNGSDDSSSNNDIVSLPKTTPSLKRKCHCIVSPFNGNCPCVSKKRKRKCHLKCCCWT